MADFNLYDFLRGMAEAHTGTLRGREEARRQQLAEQIDNFRQAVSLAQMRASEEAQRRQQMLGIAPNLTPDSQATLFEGLLRPSNPFEALGQHPFVQQQPGLKPFFQGTPRPPVMPQAPQGVPQAPRSTPGAPGMPGMPGAPGTPGAPQAAPPAAPPATGPSFDSPYGRLTLKGFDPKQAQNLLAAIKEAMKPFQDAELDEIERRSVDALLATVPQQINTPEEFQQAQQALSNLRRAAVSMGPRLQEARERKLQSDETDFAKTRDWLERQSDEVWWNQAAGMLEAEKSIAGRRKGRGNMSVFLSPHEKDLEAIRRLQETGQDEEAQLAIRALRGRLRSNLSPREEDAASREIRDRLEKMNPLQITPDLVRATYRSWRGRDVSYLIEGLPDKALRYGDARLYTRLAQAKGQLANWTNLNAEAQKLLLDEIGDLQKRLRIDIPVPDKVVQTMTPIQREQYQKLQEEREYARRRDRREDVRLQIALDKAADDRAERERKRVEEAGKLSDTQKRTLDDHDRRIAAAERKLYDVADREKVRPSEITDWDNITDPRQAKYAQAYRELQAARAAKRRDMEKMGIKVAQPQTRNVPAVATPKEEPPPPAAPGLKQRVGAIVGGIVDRVTGAPKPGQPSSAIEAANWAKEDQAAKPILKPFDERAPAKGEVLDLRRKRLDTDAKLLAGLKASIDQRNAKAAQGRLTPEQITRLNSDVARYNASLPVHRRNVELYNAGVKQMNAAVQSGQQGGQQGISRERRRRIIDDLKARGATDAEINSILRERGML